MKSEFSLAFNEVQEEKQLPRETIIAALESAMVSAYRKAVTASTAQHVEAKLDPDTGKFTIYAEKEVVDSVVDDRTEVLLEDARKVEPLAQLGDMVVVESTPADFGRVAAQTARQVIQQRIRDAERSDQVSHYRGQVGEIVNGVVQAVSSEGYTIGLDKKAEGTILRKDLIYGERFRLHDRVRALVVEVKDTPRNAQILLSRTHRNFLKRLLENEVPEIYHGIVEIRSISREPGERAKIAVSAAQQGIDPVGACVGQRGVRIQTIVRELHDEKIDVIEWNPDPTVYIAKALSPARVVGVYLGEQNNATVIVPEDQLSLAIGRDGINARLAARLTQWRIDIKSVVEAASELVHEYETGEDYVVTHYDFNETETVPCAEIFRNEEHNMDAIRGILAKKADGRPISAEDSDLLNRFVDNIEKKKASYVRTLSVAETIKSLSAKDAALDEVLAHSLKDCGLPSHVVDVLAENEYQTFGDISEVMSSNPDLLFKLHGVTPKDINDLTKISSYIGTLRSKLRNAAEPEIPAEPEPEPVEIPAEPEPEPVVEITPEPEPAPAFEEPVEEPVEEPEDLSMDQLFNTVHTELPKTEDYEDDDSGMDLPYDKSSKKKKKKKGVQMEYDPDSDSMTVRRKHKRGDDDWGW